MWLHKIIMEQKKVLFYWIFESQRIPLSKLFLIWFIGGMWITPCGYIKL